MSWTAKAITSMSKRQLIPFRLIDTGLACEVTHVYSNTSEVTHLYNKVCCSRRTATRYWLTSGEWNLVLLHYWCVRKSLLLDICHHPGSASWGTSRRECCFMWNFCQHLTNAACCMAINKKVLNAKASWTDVDVAYMQENKNMEDVYHLFT